MKTETFTIGQLAKQVGCKVETVHYYEKSGLMPEPPRTEGGHRVYNLTFVKRLNFVRKCRSLGFKVEQVKDLLKFIDEPDHYCGEIKGMAMLQARDVQSKINDLERLKTALNSMVSQCKGENFTMDNCPIVEALYVEP